MELWLTVLIIAILLSSFAAIFYFKITHEKLPESSIQMFQARIPSKVEQKRRQMKLKLKIFLFLFLCFVIFSVILLLGLSSIFAQVIGVVGIGSLATLFMMSGEGDFFGIFDYFKALRRISLGEWVTLKIQGEEIPCRVIDLQISYVLLQSITGKRYSIPIRKYLEKEIIHYTKDTKYSVPIYISGDINKCIEVIENCLKNEEFVNKLLNKGLKTEKLTVDEKSKSIRLKIKIGIEDNILSMGKQFTKILLLFDAENYEMAYNIKTEIIKEINTALSREGVAFNA